MAMCRDCGEPAVDGSVRCQPCFKAHLRGIQVAPSATPSRNVQVVRMTEREKQWEKDMPAYRSLRDQGYQPKTIDGAADLASRASTGVEIERGAIVGKEMGERIERATVEAKEAGVLK